MASLNLSTNGPSISKSYQSVVNAPAPSGAAASSPTYGQWAVYTVSAPLVNAFQQDAGNKESVLKVQSTGEGELVDLVDEFSDGRTQFAYAKVKDPNTGLPKNVLIAWCGEGVPERTKGYFTSHLAAVAKLLHGYHVQITARSDRDLTPEGIIMKVADSSGSKYSAGDAAPPVSTATKPAVSSKPAFTPTQTSGGTASFAGRGQGRSVPQKETNVDEDGWGHDAPPVTRTQLEKVSSAYQPTKVDMRELSSQQQGPVPTTGNSGPERIRGAYQPIGKVDIAAIRRQAQESGNIKDDRPEIVKGAYEPVGKVDIAAIKAKAQRPSESVGSPTVMQSADTGGSGAGSDEPKSLTDRSAAFNQSERLTSLPKPKVSNKFGGGSTFTGTKAPTPGGFGSTAAPAPAAPVGAASRTFADEGGKTPAQLWAEKKARERGQSASGDNLPSSGYGAQSPIASQTSGDGGWKSGYSGKSWAPVETTRTGKSASSIGQQQTGDADPQHEEEEEAPSSPAGGIGSIRDRFAGAPPMGAPASNFDRAAPEPDVSSKPNRGVGVPIPGLPRQQPDDSEHEASNMPVPPPQPPRSPTPPTPEAREASPIRVAMPVGRGAVTDAHEEQMSPPPAMPIRSMGRGAPEPDDDDEPDAGHDPARAAARATAAASVGASAVEHANAHADVGGVKARVEYDYEKAEDNEIELKEGDMVVNIEKVDDDWWLGENIHGDRGLL